MAIVAIDLKQEEHELIDRFSRAGTT